MYLYAIEGNKDKNVPHLQPNWNRRRARFQ